MANFIQTGGPTLIYQNTAATTSQVGSWFSVASRLRASLSFQAVMTNSSAGATCSSTTWIEVSNDGIHPCATKALTLALTNTTTDYVSDGGAFSSSMNVAWSYVRANISSLTTSTAGSAGFPSVAVYVGTENHY